MHDDTDERFRRRDKKLIQLLRSFANEPFETGAAAWRRREEIKRFGLSSRLSQIPVCRGEFQQHLAILAVEGEHDIIGIFLLETEDFASEEAAIFFDAFDFGFEKRVI